MFGFRAQSFIKHDVKPSHAANATATQTRCGRSECCPQCHCCVACFSMCILCTCPHCRRMWFYIVQVIRSHSTQHNNQWPVHYHQLYQSSPADLKWHAAPCWEHAWGWIHQGPFEIQSAWSTNGNRAFRFSAENVFNVSLSVPFTQRWHWHVCHVFPQSVPAQLAGNFPTGLTVKFIPFTWRCISKVGISQSCCKTSSGSPGV